jgi:uncharacterized protein
MTHTDRRNPFKTCAHNTSIALALSATVLAWTAHSAAAQDFNCRHAALSSEKTICANVRLSALDERMSHLYNRLWNALDSNTAREGLRDYQLRFLAARDRCGRNDTCLRGAYLDQIEVLEERLSASD